MPDPSELLPKTDVPRGAARARANEYALLPLKNVVVFPHMTMTLLVGRGKSIRAVEQAVQEGRLLMVSAQTDAAIDDPKPEDIYRTGCIVELGQVTRLADGNMQIAITGRTRATIEQYTSTEPALRVQVQERPDRPVIAAAAGTILTEAKELFEQYTKVARRPPTAEVVSAVLSINDIGTLADALAAHLSLPVSEKQALLEQFDPLRRLERVVTILADEINALEVERDIKRKVRAQIDKTQREYYLKEQLKAIQEELEGGVQSEIQQWRERLAAKQLPPYAEEKVKREITRLERMPPSSAEAVVLQNYLDWVLSLPWNERTEDRLDIRIAQQVLDEDHYGLEKVKERIIEYLAVRQLTQMLAARGLQDGQQRAEARGKGAILCFIGPPGVGKTSLARSIARAMGRKFVRISLGGVRDEAEIRGHRRTYVGSMPGRIIQAMRQAGTRNPVILLDEVDKLGADFRGDPAAALLEVLDPEQNSTFSDHYIEIPYDLSEVLFICTGNVLYSIPRPLVDRMEVIEIGGYTEDEKVAIAQRYLLPKQLREHGLAPEQVHIPEATLRRIIREYTREAGVRTLERRLAAICRKAARQVLEGKTGTIRVTSRQLEEYLGPPRYRPDQALQPDTVGVAMGLAWTEHGGELLPVEVVTMPGHGNLTITGHLGEVMKESARAALSYARSRAQELGIDPEFQEKVDLHIHLPEGAIPKDGPSAGITMATALISALSGRPVRGDVAMTGEITLRGRVLAIGGLKEKVMAAHRAGIKTIIIPKENERDLVDVPARVRRSMEVVLAETMEDVLRVALRERPAQQPVQVAAIAGGTAADDDETEAPPEGSEHIEPAVTELPPAPPGELHPPVV